MWAIFSKYSVQILLDQRCHSIQAVYDCRGNKKDTMKDLHASLSLCVKVGLSHKSKKVYWPITHEPI